ncbi:hypothetical protein [Thiolapillus sp.]
MNCRFAAIGTLLLLISGTGVLAEPLPKNNMGPRLPPVSVSVKLYSNYNINDHIYVVDDTGLIAERMKDDGLFQEVRPGDEMAPLRAWIKLKKHKQNRGGLASDVAVGLTAGLFPQVIDADYTLFVTLEYKGKKIFSSRYAAKGKISGNIFSTSYDQQDDSISRELVDHFLEDIRKNGELMDRLARQ